MLLYKSLSIIWVAPLSFINRRLIYAAEQRGNLEKFGRKKMRDSDLIRKLLKSGLTYRAISTIAKCSHGSVHQERLAVKREEEAKIKLEAEKLLAQEKEEVPEGTIVFPEIS